MTNIITIAVDAMGGDNAPKKIIDGIELYSKNNKNIYYKLFGYENIILENLKNKNINKDLLEITHT